MSPDPVCPCRDTWKCNPASKDVFSWALLRVPRPWLCPHLERVLPPALLLSDDFQEENKVLGVRCLHHIVLNVVREPWVRAGTGTDRPELEGSECHRAAIIPDSVSCSSGSSTIPWTLCGPKILL